MGQVLQVTPEGIEAVGNVAGKLGINSQAAFYYGPLVVIFIAFIAFVAVFGWILLKWMKRHIDDTTRQNSTILADVKEHISQLTNSSKAQIELLNDIADSLKPTSLIQAKDFGEVYFSLATEQVINIVRQVRKENHIVDKEATSAKVRLLIENIHKERNLRLKNHTFKGRALTHYTSEEWTQWAYEYVIKEVYHKKEDEERTRRNIKTLYNKIKLDYEDRLDRVA